MLLIYSLLPARLPGNGLDAHRMSKMVRIPKSHDFQVAESCDGSPIARQTEAGEGDGTWGVVIRLRRQPRLAWVLVLPAAIAGYFGAQALGWLAIAFIANNGLGILLIPFGIALYAAAAVKYIVAPLAFVTTGVFLAPHLKVKTGLGLAAIGAAWLATEALGIFTPMAGISGWVLSYWGDAPRWMVLGFSAAGIAVLAWKSFRLIRCSGEAQEEIPEMRRHSAIGDGEA